ncbi:MAG: Na+:solute symporter [Bacteroidales bacterium]|nr:Na+:solute symporter [Bacteroidales bacterium]MDT8430830.1 sodium:solute symporter family protein [Bacteroidales bacterium]
MALIRLDWIIIGIFFVVLISIGYFASRGAGKNTASFFLSSRNMPWWLLGVSMVATTFSCDTPNLVTDMVRTGGVASNWQWWAFLLTGMLTVFVYAKLWNRSKVLTDNEFYELRYSGKMAEFLRGFRAVYLGIFFNVMVIASVSLAFIKIVAVMLGVNPTVALIIAAAIIVFYSSLGGLKSILYTDLFQFSFALFGAVIAAVFVSRSPEIGGLNALITHPAVVDKLRIIPDINDTELFISIFLIPIAVQWWAAWYPGAEPGGGGYVVQRMLSAKNEKHAIGATMLFNFFHYALRPWPWIIVGLGSLIVFPNLDSLLAAFPHVDPQFVKNDLAYPAMLKTFLPAGLLGLVVASLIAAFMSTVASQINWASSYLVNDLYGRFIKPDATEKQKVMFGRLSTVLLMVLSVLLALSLKNALQVFRYLLMIGAGTGLLYIMRWFWWRINAWAEMVAMIAAFTFSITFIMLENFGMQELGGDRILLGGIETTMGAWNIFKFLSIVLLTTVSWIVTALVTKPVDDDILRSFYRKIKPGGPGWKRVIVKARSEGVELVKEKDLKWDVPTGIMAMLFGAMAIYSVLFAIGTFLYGELRTATLFVVIAVVSTTTMIYFWKRLRTE